MGLGGLEKEFQRAQRDRVMAVALHIKRLPGDHMTRDPLGGGLLHGFAGGFQNFIKERREVGLEFPANPIVLSLNHARDFESVTLDCQRRADSGFNPPVVVIAKHHALLSRLGLSTVEGVKAFRGELVKDHKGRRDIFCIKTIADDGRPLVLFLKRNWKPYKKDGLHSLLRRGKVWSIARQEWENSQVLGAAGLKTAEPVAYGEECGPLWEKFSFLVTEAAPGAQTLEQFLSECRDRRRRQAVFDALAREIRKLHDAGLATPDLFSRHLFVDESAAPPGLCLIDMTRLNRRSSLPTRIRARDLAALNVTAPLRHVTARERVRFLRLYAGRSNKPLAHRIARRVEYLLQRRKFRRFLEGVPEAVRALTP
jgi:heptose I phosphotransferase